MYIIISIRIDLRKLYSCSACPLCSLSNSGRNSAEVGLYVPGFFPRVFTGCLLLHLRLALLVLSSSRSLVALLSALPSVFSLCLVVYVDGLFWGCSSTSSPTCLSLFSSAGPLGFSLSLRLTSSLSPNLVLSTCSTSKLTPPPNFFQSRNSTNRTSTWRGAA